MTDAPHQCFTVSATSYLRNLDREEINEQQIAVHFQQAPVLHEDGRKSISLNYPILILSLYISNREEIAEKVARILNKHWDDEE